MTAIWVYSGSESSPDVVGIAYVEQRRRRPSPLSSTFAYDQSYLVKPHASAFDPELPLQSGNWPLSHELPGSFMDASPDRWGRNLIRRRYPERKLNNRALRSTLC
jgi:serine/threonine-protein kinase HipA